MWHFSALLDMHISFCVIVLSRLHDHTYFAQVIQVSQIMHKDTGFVLSTNNDSSAVSMCPRHCLPHSTQFWLLDFRLDGTFLIISNTKEKLVLSCDSNTRKHKSAESRLILSQFIGDENQLWWYDGGHIESVGFKDQVISLMPGSQPSLCLSTISATDKAQLFKLEVSIFACK